MRLPLGQYLFFLLSREKQADFFPKSRDLYKRHSLFFVYPFKKKYFVFLFLESREKTPFQGLHTGKEYGRTQIICWVVGTIYKRYLLFFVYPFKKNIFAFYFLGLERKSLLGTEYGRFLGDFFVNKMLTNVNNKIPNFSLIFMHFL